MLSTSVYVLSRKKDSAKLLFFLSKNPCGHAIYRQNSRVSEKRNFNPGLHERVDVRTILTETKFLGWKDDQIFLPRAPL